MLEFENDLEFKNENKEEFNLDYETTYGHCLAKNPYWFIPDLECNTEKELLSWRHALFAVKQGTFESPEHYFWKTLDAPLTKGEVAEILKDCDSGIVAPDDNGKIVIHGHNTPWGMGISAFSDKINVWKEHSHYEWILELAESEITDEQYLSAIKNHEEQRKKEYEEWKRNNKRS